MAHTTVTDLLNPNPNKPKAKPAPPPKAKARKVVSNSFTKSVAIDDKIGDFVRGTVKKLRVNPSKAVRTVATILDNLPKDERLVKMHEDRIQGPRLPNGRLNPSKKKKKKTR